MASEDNEPDDHRKHYAFWIGLLVVILITLCMVPFAAIGLAIKKSGVLGHGVNESEEPGSRRPSLQQALDLSGLRATVEKTASSIIHAPEQVGAALKQIAIEAPPASIQKAVDSVRQVLAQDHRQFVEAVDQDKIRIIVIIKSKDWPNLAGQLQMAAEKDGFIYRGPSETSTAGEADSVLAQIEILRKQAK